MRALDRGTTQGARTSPGGNTPARVRRYLRGEEGMERTFETPHPVRLDVQKRGRAGHRRGQHRRHDRRGGQRRLARRRRVSSSGPSSSAGITTTSWSRSRARARDSLSVAGVTVVVNLPERSDVTVVTASADVDVTGLVGSADFTTASGDVTTDDVAVGLSGPRPPAAMSPWAVWAGRSGWRPHRGICAARSVRGPRHLHHGIGRRRDRSGRGPGGGEGDLRQSAPG